MKGLPLFPLCRLHGHNIVTAFPDACPLGDQDVNGALCRIHDKSFWDSHGDPHPAVAAAAVHECCNDCAVRLLSNPHVQFLRRRAHA